MRKLTALFFVLLSASLALPLPSARADGADYAVTASLGTTGVGLEWIKPLGDRLDVRLVAQYGVYDFDYEESGIDYDAEYKSANFGALLDWRPFGGTFRLTGGLVTTSFGIDLDADTNGGEFELGGSIYRGDVRLSGEANYAHIAPYLAIGWSSNPRNSGMYYGTELGVMYVGSPNLLYGGQGCVEVPEAGGTCVPVSMVPEFQDDLEQERQDLEDDLDDYAFWPILSVSIGYRF